MRLTAILLGLFALTACEAVEGTGQSISNAGEVVSDSAQAVDNEI